MPALRVGDLAVRVRAWLLPLALLLVAASTSRTALAQTYEANPGNVADVVPLVQAGDTLRLAEGDYGCGLDLTGKHGTAASPIVITGPEDRTRVARIVGRVVQDATVDFPGTAANVLLGDSSYLVVRNLTLDGWDGRTLAYTVAPMYLRGLSTVYSADTVCHHITVENLTIMNYGGNQSNSAISTKTPVWDWTIRRNLVIGSGTGMYLGNSDGTMPFVRGLIEDNIVVNTVGYNIQIKHQLLGTRDVAGMPAEAVTLIRNNVFSNIQAPYNYAGINAGARPNLLVDPFPPSGNGSNDRYQIYGNFFYQNYESDALFQGAGNLALHNNLFVNGIGTKQAVNIQAHNGSNRKLWVFFNTVLAGNRGIRVADIEAGYEGQQFVFGNAVFAATPLSLAAGVQQFDNVTDSFANAGSYLVNPSAALGQLDLFPLAGALKGAATDTSSVQAVAQWDRDFNGAARDPTFRGAYSGEGANLGWLPVRDHKPTAFGLGLPVMPANRAPVISSGPTAAGSPATPGEEMAFSVVAEDPDGDGLTVLWHFGDGVLGSGPSVRHAYWQDATTPVANATYTVKVLVRDSWGASCSATLQVQVGQGGSPVLLSGGIPDLVLGGARTDGNHAPVAEAQNVATTEDTAKAVTLTGSDADAGDTLSYWVLTGPAHGVLSGTAPALTYTPAADYSGTDSFTFKVSDGKVDSSVATVSITVTAANDPPSISSFSPASPTMVTVDTTQAFSVDAWDPDGDELSYTWKLDSGADTAGTETFNYSPSASDIGSHTIKVTISDGHGGSVSRTWAVTVLARNHRDFTGDGKADILWRELPATGKTVLWTMNGATKTASAYTSASASTAWVVAGVADFTGDGKADILWRETATGKTVVWTMNGATKTASAYTSASASTAWVVAGVADFTGDGKADILWRESSSGKTVVWTMDGATKTASAYTSASASNSWVVAGVADFTGDGKADILWRESSTGKTVVWTMNGATKTASAYTSASAGTGWVVQ
jgi:hypothetical protein